ncbi:MULTISPECIES: NAD(P)-dependent alcohol dehydrogenase [Anaeromyxobacter]|uniref:NAD(P)-dependent alcohol dehydrogenase n=1 Tax=Anaeromyxobacter TaxID=161492 RepID=UPI001F595BCD|nr:MULTISPECIES: NAD(P)-dependent alcohol dehydrogenase [unclassified Anaeromyxobacter]
MKNQIAKRPPEREPDSHDTTTLSRRGFMWTGALAAAGAGAAGLFKPSTAGAAPGVERTSYGQGPFPVEGMALYSSQGPHKPMKFQRRALGPKDVAIKLQYCGICHSDIHHGREHWRKETFPLVTGHELAGVVVAVGSSVSKFKVGSRVGVGCMVNSCRHCGPCEAGMEQYCENGSVLTYGSKDRDGSLTQGGYSTFDVVDEDFVIAIPDAIDLAHAGPMLCAGITVYSPFRRWSVGPGKKVGVVGLGGLGHMATKIAAAMGAQVTVLTTSRGKVDDARRFGAKTVIVNDQGADLAKYRRSLDFILDTVPYQHDLERLIPLLKMDSTLCMVGVGKTTEPHQIGPFSLLRDRTSFASSQIGGIRETQELVQFCELHGIRPEITKVPMSRIDDAWTKVVDKAARYRFVIDMTNA